MSKTTILNIGIICIGILISTIVLNLSYNTSADNTVPMETLAPINERSSYILKEYDGKIGVFRGDAEKPYTYLDMEISYLNEYDRNLIANGIEVSTEDELKTLIEDLTS